MVWSFEGWCRKREREREVFTAAAVGGYRVGRHVDWILIFPEADLCVWTVEG